MRIFRISLDIETFSEVSLRLSGVYKYAMHKSFEILMLTFRINRDEFITIDIANGEKIPEYVIDALFDPEVQKHAFNAIFERVCFMFLLKQYISPANWHCTSVKAGILGYPMNLEGAARIAGIDAQKDKRGSKCISYFSIPCKATKVNGGRTRNFPIHDVHLWADYLDYNRQDVVAECALDDAFSWYPISAFEQLLYEVDQLINDNGVQLDSLFITNIIEINRIYKDKLTFEAKELTKLGNPNSVKQLTPWLSNELGIEVSNLKKQTVTEILEGDLVSPGIKAKRMLELRQEMSKTSITKFSKMMHCICSDGRAHGLLQFYGASKTGRWAGRLIQVQNLPKNKVKKEDYYKARRIVSRTASNYGSSIAQLTEHFKSVPFISSELIRASFVAGKGKVFGVADYAGIEARVLAWLANAKWKMRAFAEGKDVYILTASKMFGIPEADIKKESPERAKGKVCELACGYQGSYGALLKVEGVLKMIEEAVKHIPKSDVVEREAFIKKYLTGLAYKWRDGNPEIRDYWYEVQDAAISAVEGKPVTIRHGIKFFTRKGDLFIKLPSGRHLIYHKARIVESYTEYGYKKQIAFQGVDQDTFQYKMDSTYGGKLVENLCQAIARDCLAVGLLRVHSAGHKIVMHIHDELVNELDQENAEEDIKSICSVMGKPIKWAPGLLLTAEGFLTPFYRKE